MNKLPNENLLKMHVIAAGLLLLGALILWFRDKQLKVYLSRARFTPSKKHINHAEAAQKIQAALPEFFVIDDNNTVMKIQPSLSHIPDSSAFCLGNFQDRSKMNIDGEIPAGSIYIKRSIITALLDEIVLPQLESSETKFKPFKGYLRDWEQLRVLVATIRHLEDDPKAPKHIKLTRTRKRYLSAFEHIIKNPQEWDLSFGKGVNPITHKNVAIVKRNIRNGLIPKLNFKSTSHTYDQFIDETYEPLVRWIDSINTYLENNSDNSQN